MVAKVFLIALFYFWNRIVSVYGRDDLLIDKPFVWKKAETARWLAHQNIWGTISTTSVHLNGRAWGQPKSFVDGSISNSTGVLYFYDSDMDTSVQVTFNF